ncbi:hypothetical protein V2J09_018757 [Rumex salicifolius]
MEYELVLFSGESTDHQWLQLNTALNLSVPYSSVSALRQLIRDPSDADSTAMLEAPERSRPRYQPNKLFKARRQPTTSSAAVYVFSSKPSRLSLRHASDTAVVS